jgi:hypothetical protein
MGEDEGFTVGGMNRARAASMEWSPPLPLPGMLGVDGSLLAVGNWAGGIDFWACSPERNFSRAATVDLPKPWAAEVTWSQWMTVDDSVCE